MLCHADTCCRIPSHISPPSSLALITCLLQVRAGSLQSRYYLDVAGLKAVRLEPQVVVRINHR